MLTPASGCLLTMRTGHKGFMKLFQTDVMAAGVSAKEGALHQEARATSAGLYGDGALMEGYPERQLCSPRICNSTTISPFGSSSRASSASSQCQHRATGPVECPAECRAAATQQCPCRSNPSCYIICRDSGRRGSSGRRSKSEGTYSRGKLR